MDQEAVLLRIHRILGWRCGHLRIQERTGDMGRDVVMSGGGVARRILPAPCRSAAANKLPTPTVLIVTARAEEVLRSGRTVKQRGRGESPGIQRNLAERV